MAKPRSSLASLILLVAGIFVGYQLAVVHLQTEKVAGQVILSQRQFQHMLRSMDHSGWNQQRVTTNWMGDGYQEQAEESQGPSSESINFDLIKYDEPTHTPPNVDDFVKGSCRRLWETNNGSRWFQERLAMRTPPFWEQKNLNLSLEVFDWWNSIQPGNESFSQVYKLVQTLLPSDEDKTEMESSLRGHGSCLRCAIVGNSANIVNSSYGPFIDAHNFVFRWHSALMEYIRRRHTTLKESYCYHNYNHFLKVCICQWQQMLRMNKCPTEEYKQDVGSRVTHYIAYPESYYQEYLKDDALLLFTAYKANDLKWLQNYLSSVRKAPDNKHLALSKVRLYNPELMWNAKHIWGVGRGRYPSTGFLAVIFALYTCDEVNIFGYGPNQQGYWDHYYSNNSGESNSFFQKTLVHDAQAELNLLYRLDALGKITIYHGLR